VWWRFRRYEPSARLGGTNSDGAQSEHHGPGGMGKVRLADAIYIGDRSEDGESADANGLLIIAVTWGFRSRGPAEMKTHWQATALPVQL